MSQFIGLDVGTQGTKGIVIDLARGEAVARASRSYGLIQGLADGAAEQDPQTWWDAVVAVVREMVSDPAVDAPRIAGLGVSGQQHGFVPLDGSGQVIRPAKLWCDTSTAAEAEELGVPAGFTASKILWLKRHEPTSFARLAQVMLPHDWLNQRLTSGAWMEAGDASGTGFFDPRRRTFDLDRMAAIDARLHEWLPPLVAPDQIAGEISTEAAEALHLPTGLPVSPGGGDNMMSAIGSGAVRSGVCTLSLGTSGTVFSFAPDPVADESAAIAPFCDSTGGWLPLLCVMNATGVVEEVRGANGDLSALTEAAGSIAAGSDGLLFLPYLSGERVPDLPRATGTLLGMRPGALDPPRLFRAALEGTSLSLGWGVDRMRALSIEPGTVRVVGGGARNELWCRILASVMNVRIERLVEAESAALGAALQAAWCVDGSGAREKLEALSAPFLRIEGDPIEPVAADVETYAALSQRFRAEVGRIYD